MKIIFTINSRWIYKIANSPLFGSKKFIFFDINNNKKEIDIPKSIIYAEFANITSKYVYLYASVFVSGTYITKMLVFNKELQIRLIQILQDDDTIWGEILPLIDIDSEGNIYQLCLKNNKFILYKYSINSIF